MLQSTPLHWAANNGHVDTIKKLVELGARSCLPMHLFSSCSYEDLALQAIKQCHWAGIYTATQFSYCRSCKQCISNEPTRLDGTAPRCQLGIRRLCQDASRSWRRSLRSGVCLCKHVRAVCQVEIVLFAVADSLVQKFESRLSFLATLLTFCT